MNNSKLDDDLVSIVLTALNQVSVHDEDGDLAKSLSPYLVDYAIKSLSWLNAFRDEGGFADKEFPDILGYPIYSLAATCAKAIDVPNAENIAELLRERRPDNGISKHLN